MSKQGWPGARTLVGIPCALFVLALLLLAAPPASPPAAAQRRACPRVEVRGPDSFPEGVWPPLTYTATITPPPPDGQTPTYRWRLSAGTITSGRTTSQIEVNTRGQAGRPIRATVVVGNLGQQCNREVSASRRTSIILALPNQPPTVSLSGTTRTVVLAAECADNQRPDPDCTPTATAVRFSANVTDPDGDTVRYKWSVGDNMVEGEGPDITLDFAGFNPGVYTVIIEVDDGAGMPAFDTWQMTVSRCGCVNRQPGR